MAAKATSERIGLAMSGGGYRAGLFHLGALWRLNELGWLRKLDEISSVSGGSIVAAYLGTRWSELDFDDETNVAANFESAFVNPMRNMFGTTIDLQTIGTGLLNPFGSTRGKVKGRQVIDGAVGILGEVVELLGGSTSRKYATSFAQPLVGLFGAGIDVSAAIWDRNPFPTPSDQLIKKYDRLLFHGKTLQDLPDPDVEGNPYFTLFATNMQTGAHVRMAREYVKDYKLGEVRKPTVSLATAVAASSGFPPFYTPVGLDFARSRWSAIEKKLADRDDLREHMDLGDGAVYDNMGLTRALQRPGCDTVLVSDAGDSLDIIDALPFEWLSQAIRTLVVAMDQSNKLRVNDLRSQFYNGKRKGAYWGIAEDIAELGWGERKPEGGQTAESKKTLEEVGKHAPLPGRQRQDARDRRDENPTEPLHR